MSQVSRGALGSTTLHRTAIPRAREGSRPLCPRLKLVRVFPPRTYLPRSEVLIVCGGNVKGSYCLSVCLSVRSQRVLGKYKMRTIRNEPRAPQAPGNCINSAAVCCFCLLLLSAVCFRPAPKGFVPYGAPAIRSAATTWGRRSSSTVNSKRARAATPAAAGPALSGLQMHQVTIEVRVLSFCEVSAQCACCPN